uniref:Uncharacterized protein n=1 Tax=Anguilla anguilla TaxID=7936 RepID=A0A0E9S7X2_ANGAN
MLGGFFRKGDGRCCPPQSHLWVDSDMDDLTPNIRLSQ